MAYDDYRATKFENTDVAEINLEKCGFDHLDDQLIDCSASIADSLYAIIRGLDDRHVARNRVRQDAETIQGQCKPPQPPM
ncbi:MAG: hypothetical protein EXR07_13485 [Acetobacteraceae bacterium]|nr:hypothetical protein [Acetobacteraceae bacterium]